MDNMAWSTYMRIENFHGPVGGWAHSCPVHIVEYTPLSASPILGKAGMARVAGLSKGRSFEYVQMIHNL